MMPILPARLPPHPRLLAEAADWPRLRILTKNDPHAKCLWEALRERAGRLLGQPPLERHLIGRRLLMVSREALDRIGVLALVANVSGDGRYAERAIAEMLAIARFPDWNPAHFLDTAEMSFAVALGYDWLFYKLGEAERDEISGALIDKALHVSLDPAAQHNWWLNAIENWSQVCNGGLGAAAIAIADREPVLAERILARALEKIPGVAATYAPDGAYPEGPMYWSYGTSYHVVLAAALKRLSGSTFGLDAFPGFAESADYLAQVTAPTGRYFNYADCNDRRRLQAPLFWMARHFGRGDWLVRDLGHLKDDLAEYRNDPGVQYGYYDMLALALLWFQPLPAGTDAVPQRNWFGRGAMPVAVLREGNTYVAVKGGGAALSHAHMDVGSFIMEADGVRWAIDPGMQDYESLERAGVDLWNEAQASARWGVFRIGPEAHNILRFGDAAQNVSGNAQFVVFRGEGVSPCCILDLTPIYAGDVSSARRGTGLGAGGIVLFQDEWVAHRPGTRAAWQLLTEAEVGIDSRDIRLHQAGKRMVLKVLDPTDVSIAVEDVSAPRRPYDAPNPGLKRIRVTTQAVGGLFRILAVPEGTDTRIPLFLPLADWGK